jgi:hypothetical protein
MNPGYASMGPWMNAGVKREFRQVFCEPSLLAQNIQTNLLHVNMLEIQRFVGKPLLQSQRSLSMNQVTRYVKLEIPIDFGIAIEKADGNLPYFRNNRRLIRLLSTL